MHDTVVARVEDLVDRSITREECQFGLSILHRDFGIIRGTSLYVRLWCFSMKSVIQSGNGIDIQFVTAITNAAIMHASRQRQLEWL